MKLVYFAPLLLASSGLADICNHFCSAGAACAAKDAGKNCCAKNNSQGVVSVLLEGRKKRKDKKKRVIHAHH